MKCCKCGSETQETVSANHPNADRYCRACGTCAHCGESVAYFIHEDDLGLWLCPCVALRRHEVVEVRKYEPGITSQPEEKKPIEFGKFVARRKKSSRAG